MSLKMIPVTKWSCAGVRPEGGLGEDPEPVCEGCSRVRGVGGDDDDGGGGD